jgi:hypothetical protein
LSEDFQYSHVRAAGTEVAEGSIFNRCDSILHTGAQNYTHMHYACCLRMHTSFNTAQKKHSTERTRAQSRPQHVTQLTCHQHQWHAWMTLSQ